MKKYWKYIAGIVLLVGCICLLCDFQTITLGTGQKVFVYDTLFNHTPGGSAYADLFEQLSQKHGEGERVKQPIDIWNGEKADVYDTYLYGFEYLGQDFNGGDYILCTVDTLREVELKESDDVIDPLVLTNTYIAYDDGDLYSLIPAAVLWDTMQTQCSTDLSYFVGTIPEARNVGALVGLIGAEEKFLDADVSYEVLDNEYEFVLNVLQVELSSRDENVVIIDNQYSEELEPFYDDGKQSFWVNGTVTYTINDVQKKTHYSICVYTRQWNEEV